MLDDYQNDSTTSGFLNSGASINGNIEMPFDQDWIRVTLVAGQTYTFRVSNATSDLASNFLFGGFFTSSNTLIPLEQLIHTSIPFSQFSFTPPTSGDYFLSVNAQNDLTGGYVLSANNSATAMVFDHTIQGSNFSESLYGSPQADLIQGFAGDDFLDGYEGNDTLIGGTGNDQLFGNSGNDTYIFSKGNGHDIYIDKEGTNTIKFNDVSSTDTLQIFRTGYSDLVIQYSSTDQITIQNYYEDNAKHPAKIIFSDGIVFNFDEIATVKQTIKGNSGDDFLNPANYNDSTYLIGQEGNDQLTGGMNNDILWGGKGQDHLDGQDGNDIYIFSKGDGQDAVIDPSGNNIIRFTDVKSTDSVTFFDPYSYSSNSMSSTLRYSENDSIMFINSSPMQLQNFTFEFADGVSLTMAQMQQRGLQLSGTEQYDALHGTMKDDTLLGKAGDDFLDGHEGNDVLIGGIGNDYLAGYTGNDSYVFSKGDGHDTIDDKEGSNFIEFKDVKSTELVDLIRPQGSNDLVIRYADNDDIFVYGFFSNPYNSTFQFTFSDGVTLSGRDIFAMLTAIKGFSGNDGLIGTDGNDLILAQAGDDFVDAGLGDDTLIGGTGNDRLFGNGGNDTFVFSKGDGHDVYIDKEGNNVVKFNNVASNEVLEIIRVNTNDLLIRYTNQDDILLPEFFEFNSSYGYYKQPAYFEFSDGVRLTSQELLASQNKLVGDANSNQLYGSFKSEYLIGNAGDDFLDAREGDDILIGGTGQDILLGGMGKDTYIFNKGDGNDIVDEFYNSDGIFNIRLNDVKSTDNFQISRDSVNGSADLIIQYSPTDNVRLINFFNTPATQNATLTFSDGVTLQANDIVALSNTFRGDDSNNQINGNLADNTLIGNAGDDFLDAREGNDTLIGGTGQDMLVGGMGRDTYIFSKGDGLDVVKDIDGNGVIFLTDVKSTEIMRVYSDNSYDLIIRYGNSDEIRIANFLYDNPHNVQLRFSDGVTLNGREILTPKTPIIGTDSGEAIRVPNFTPDGDYILGKAGNDNILGSFGNDVIIGGTGSDNLSDVGGSDTYIFSKGDGWDKYSDQTGQNIIRFTDVKSTDNMAVVGGAQGQVSLQYGNGDRIDLSSFANDNSARPARFEFSDGVIWTADQLFSLANYQMTFTGTSNNESMIGSQYNDTLLGYAGNDTLTGYRGNDMVNGGSGNDTYVFNKGDGNDTMMFNDLTSAIDTLKISGYKESEAIVSRSSNDLVINFASNPADRIVISNYYALVSNSSDNKVDSINFSDSNVWTATYIDYLANGGKPSVAPTASNTNLNLTTVEATDFVYNLNNQFKDADNDTLRYEVKTIDGSSLPNWLTIDSATGQLSGIPPVGAPDLKLSVTAIDPAGRTTTSTIVLTIADNQPATISTPLSSLTTVEAESFDFNLDLARFKDPEGKNLIFSISQADGSALPEWMHFDSTLGKLNGIVPLGSTDVAIKVTATDTIGLTTTEVTTLYITPNQAPTLSAPVADMQSVEGVAFAFDLQPSRFHDPENTHVTIVVTQTDGSALPSWLTYDSVTGQLSGTAPLDTGHLDIKLTATDAVGLTTVEKATLNFTPNQAPTFTQEISDLLIQQGDAVNAQLPIASYSDPENSALAFSVAQANGESLPAWLSFDRQTGQLYGVAPQNAEHLALTLTAIDAVGNTVSDNFGLIVNARPQLVNPIADLTVVSAETLTTNVVNAFIDPEGQSLSYQLNLANAEPLPNWVVFDAQTGQLSANPPLNYAGNLTFVLTANDAQGGVSQDTFTLAVKRNQAPMMEVGLSDLVATEGVLSTVNIQPNRFSDPEDTAVTVKVTQADGSALPSWVSYDASKGILSAISPVDLETLALRITATDDVGLSTSEAITLHFTPNQAPTVTKATPDALIQEGESLALQLPLDSFSDPEGLSLSYTLSQANGDALPSWLTFNNQTGLVTGIAPHGEQGISLKLTATDNIGQTVSDDFNITINQRPVNVQPLPNMSAVNGEAFQFNITQVNFADPEGGKLAYQLVMTNGEPLPTWLTFDSDTGIITGNAPLGTVGLLPLQLSVTDGLGGKLIQPVNLTFAQNQTPTGGVNLATQNVAEGSVIDYKVDLTQFHDPEGSKLIFTATTATEETLPSWLTFDSATGRVYGNAPIGAESLIVVVKATDHVGLSSTTQLPINLTYKDLTLSAPTFGGTVNGQSGNDVINGSWYVDTLYGRKGDDTLNGSLGNDTLYGNEGNDTLDGGSGLDTMYGGLGNDKYYVDQSGDKIIELTNEGIDTVYAKSDFTLSANLENLTLSGTMGYKGIGNLLDNALIGNNGANILDGQVGNDKLLGGKGNDTLLGGLGNDSYEFFLGDGADKITDIGGNDVINIHGNLQTTNISFKQSGNNLIISINGTSDSMTVTDWFTNTANQIETIHLDSGATISNTSITSMLTNQSTGSLSSTDYQNYWII